MQKNKEYKNTIFPVETLKKAITEFDSLAKTDRTIEVAKVLSTKKENGLMKNYCGNKSAVI